MLITHKVNNTRVMYPLSMDFITKKNVDTLFIKYSWLLLTILFKYELNVINQLIIIF